MFEQAEIIQMARKAGIPDSWDTNWFDPHYERFATIVAEAAKEKVLEQQRQMLFDRQLRYEESCAAALMGEKYGNA